MQYLSVKDLSKSHGIKPLFSNISFNIEEGDKVALVAKNGAGKSTLMKILVGKEKPDSGAVWIDKNVNVVFLNQDEALDEEKTVLEIIFSYDHPILNAIRIYEDLSEQEHPDADAFDAALTQMNDLEAWDFDTKVRTILTQLKIDHLQQKAGTLSGGQRKRVALAKVLLDVGFNHQMCLLLMDEPTNHLDVDMVEWLENYLQQNRVTLLLVTHDRYFLDSVCNQIIEIDRQNIHIYKGDYETYLTQKAQREEQEQASIDKAKNLLRKELEWMRRQPKARTTKSKSRIDAFYDLKDKAQNKIEDSSIALEIKMSRLGNKIIELKDVNKKFGEKVILDQFNYTFKKGEKIGIIGHNGAGKSTFLKILQGLETIDSGLLDTGETVIFGNYSQEGLVIKEDKRVVDFVKDIAEYFPLADGGKITASQFLTRFLFPPEQQYSYISTLSGGEKKRLQLLTVLFKNPNFLILDEPTNDLDLATLSVLEDFLEDYPGCLLIVSHDRYFMDRLVQHLMVFEGQGEVSFFNGTYSSYRELQKANKEQPKTTPKIATPVAPTPQPPTSKTKLSFKEKQEFDTLEKDIERLQEEKTQLEAFLTNGESNLDVLQKNSQRIAEIIATIDAKEIRWLELSEK